MKKMKPKMKKRLKLQAAKSVKRQVKSKEKRRLFHIHGEAPAAGERRPPGALSWGREGAGQETDEEI